MKILLVDDELVSLCKLEQLIKDLNHQPLVADDGETAWKIWQREKPDIVITDWMMPKMDGPRLCTKIRKAESGGYTYLILVTSKNNSQDIVAGMEAGADDYITKPFHRDELIARIKAGERVLNLQIKDLVIFAMAKLAESRDPETGQHLNRIRSFSKILTQALSQSGKSEKFPEKIDSQFVDNIYLTSPLHDIGKVGIPDSVLLKPGRLNEKEFSMMKNHSLIGYETLRDAFNMYPKASFLKMSCEIALNHHERVDGSGYPNGLKKEDIPLSARIVALADVYDALVSVRVYKKAFTHDVAKSIIEQDSGKHFDPDIVDAFLRCETDFIKISDEFKETAILSM